MTALRYSCRINFIITKDLEMNTFTKTLVGATLLLTAAFAFGFGSAREHAQTRTTNAGVGDEAPAFKLVDLDGQEHTLEQYTKEGKTVVLEWFSPSCPFVRKHYREDTMTMVKLQEEFKDEEVVWIRVNSAHAKHPSASVDLNKETAQKWEITTPILMDPEGTTGRAYGAKRTPEMFIVDDQGIIVYHGAIDNDRGAQSAGKENYVRNALDAVLAGKEVPQPKTKAYGCSIKYK